MRTNTDGVGTVLYAGAWRVESVWIDRDGTGERTWNRAVDPHDIEHWCTTSALQELLRRHGLDIGDLSPAPAPRRITDPDDGCE